VNKPCLSQFSPHMCKYQQFLRRRYELLKKPDSIDKMMPNCCPSHYIDLTLTKVNKQIGVTSADHEEGDTVTVPEILNFEGNNNVILIKGDPGMGKTTLAISICKSWAEGKLLNAFTVVLLFLRDPEVQKAKTIGDLLMTPDDELRKYVVKEITNDFGKNVCFIFEGFDELPEELYSSSIFINLKEMLPECAIVYTSRPETCHELEHVACKSIEIKGFTDCSICNYIAYTFKDIKDQTKLYSELKNSHFSTVKGLNILSIPIVLAIMCLIFSYDNKIPKTLTELYTLFCIRLVLRHVTTRASTEYQVTALRSLDRLPDNISKQFSQLCCFAYKSVQCNKLIFTSQDLKDVGIVENEMNNIGLIVTAPSSSIFGIEKSYNFMHKTVQEFCAAWHISKAMSPEDQLACITSYRHDYGYRMVWIFYSGITKFSNKEALKCMLPYKLMNSCLTSRTVSHLIKCVYETQNNEVCQIVAEHFDGYLPCLSNSWPSNSYFLMQCKDKIKILNADNANEMIFHKLIQTLQKGYINGESCLTLNFSLCSLPYMHLFYLTGLHFAITKLFVVGMRFTATSDTANDHTDPNVPLHLLEKLCNINSVKRSTTSSVSKMELTMKAVHCSDFRNGHLIHLSMLHCQLDAAGISKISELLQDNASITSIGLTNSLIDDQNIESIVNHIGIHGKIQDLSLCSNSITAAGACHLVKLMETLTSLELSQNPLKDEGVHVILSSLKSTMEYIGLQNVEMTSVSYPIVADTLHKVKSISFNIPTADCEVIIKSLPSTVVISEIQLQIENLSINHGLLSAVSHIQSLTLNYDVSTIWVEGAMCTWVPGVISLLEQTKTLEELYITSYDIIGDSYLDRDTILMFAESFKRNKSVEVLHYSDTSMTMDITVQFLELLTEAYTLEVVKLKMSVDPNEYRDNYRRLAKVEKHVRNINLLREQKGVNTLLNVTVEEDVLAYL